MKYRTKTVQAYLQALGAGEAIPGGGSAAALCAALGIALSLMVARITAQKKDFQKKKSIRVIVRALAGLEKRVQRIIDTDPLVYGRVAAAYQLPKVTAGRAERIEKSLVASYCVMYELASFIVTAASLNEKLFALSSGALANDLSVSKSFLEAALQAAISTARINTCYMKNARLKKAYEGDLARLCKRKK